MKNFVGPDLTESDDMRLTSQYYTIFKIMSSGKWFTLGQIERLTGFPQASISAQIRHFRKKQNGSHEVSRKHLGNGLYSYRLELPNKAPCLDKVWGNHPSELYNSSCSVAGVGHG